MRGIILFCILALVWGQTVDHSLVDELKNPQFVKVLNNYFGCKTWDNGVCVQCSDHYYFNANGVCCEVKPQCKNFNRQVGICEACYEGYGIVNGQCVRIDLINSDGAGCKTWISGKCAECSTRWYFDNSGVCKPISEQCRSWTSAGQCESCYSGYVVSSGQCILDPNPFIPASNDLCSIWSDRVCIKCADRAFFDSNGICREVSNQCSTWDKFDGVCLSCYNGYNLVKGQCVEAPISQPTDLGCKIWDWNNQICLTCSARWTFNSKGACVPVSDQCNQWDAAGACVSCYKGYDLVKGQCVQSAVQQPTDLGCKTWDWDRQVCLECSARWTFNSKGACVPVSDQCNQWDAAGACVSCYAGYQAVNGRCQVLNSLCKTSNTNGTCATCYTGYVLYKNNCTPLSKLADLVLYYTACCPQKLEELKKEGRL